MASFVPLGTADHFVLLAGSGITVAGAVGSTKLTGDIGTFPTTTVTGIGNAVLVGSDFSTNTPVMTQAKLDLVTAYNNAAGQGPAITVPTELGGTSPAPGVYNSAAGTFGITTQLILDAKGNPNAVWIFQMASTLTTGAGSSVVLLNGAQACNVFWQVGSSATLGTTTAMVGNILALTSITITTSATLNGSALARNGAVTLDTNTCVDCALAGSGGATSLVALQPCLACYSKTQLLQVLLWALAAHHDSGYNLAGGDLAKLFKDSSCYNCYADSQLLDIVVGSILSETQPGIPVKTISKSITCLQCANPKQVRSAIAFLITKIGLPA